MRATQTLGVLTYFTKKVLFDVRSEIQFVQHNIVPTGKFVQTSKKLDPGLARWRQDVSCIPVLLHVQFCHLIDPVHTIYFFCVPDISKSSDIIYYYKIIIVIVKQSFSTIVAIRCTPLHWIWGHSVILSSGLRTSLNVWNGNSWDLKQVWFLWSIIKVSMGHSFSVRQNTCDRSSLLKRLLDAKCHPVATTRQPLCWFLLVKHPMLQFFITEVCSSKQLRFSLAPTLWLVWLGWTC